ncbi:hypothetical protein MHM98_12010 [Psychrobium sp. MM17-31]|uniref:hypothetical protein n=1 Tax=Psychrobium sp. MM17-31 TaxID=2917758 RepID=UPI001EF3DC41|nr:hypothetical protein [Psychrobium sp. MM17-31]MCG7532060.1 hypothetical protein [Psychrobium sp. MM17-31]
MRILLIPIVLMLTAFSVSHAEEPDKLFQNDWDYSEQFPRDARQKVSHKISQQDSKIHILQLAKLDITQGNIKQAVEGLNSLKEPELTQPQLQFYLYNRANLAVKQGNPVSAERYLRRLQGDEFDGVNNVDGFWLSILEGEIYLLTNEFERLTNKIHLLSRETSLNNRVCRLKLLEAAMILKQQRKSRADFIKSQLVTHCFSLNQSVYVARAYLDVVALNYKAHDEPEESLALLEDASTLFKLQRVNDEFINAQLSLAQLYQSTSDDRLSKVLNFLKPLLSDINNQQLRARYFKLSAFVNQQIGDLNGELQDLKSYAQALADIEKERRYINASYLEYSVEAERARLSREMNKQQLLLTETKNTVDTHRLILSVLLITLFSLVIGYWLLVKSRRSNV